MERHLSVRPTTKIAKGAPSLRFTVLGSAELTGPDTEGLRTALVQPKRLALLAYLALATPRGFHRRDSLVALFWPDSDESRARHALRQALHVLRRAMGSEAIVSRGDNEIAIDESALWCDARAFEDAIHAGDPDTVISLYRGDLLPGFFVANASSEFDAWLNSERTRLKAHAATAAWALADRAETGGDGVSAARWARRALEFSPDDERSVRRVIALLDRLGDRAGALRAHDDFSRLLAAEFEAEPSAETKALVASVRARHRAHDAADHAVGSNGTPNAQHTPEPQPKPAPKSDAQHSRQNPPRRISRIARIVTGVAATIAIAAAGYAKFGDRGADSRLAIIAVGNIAERGLSAGDLRESSGTLRELLATDLARVTGVQVISNSRLYEVLGQMGNRDASASALSEAAVRAGATELLEGVLYRTEVAGRPYRLDLRRIDLSTGVVSRAYSADGTDLFSLVDSVTSQFAGAIQSRPPAVSLAGVTSTSLPARRFYEEGMRWYYRGESVAAGRYFLSALDEDSTFGMAAFYANQTSVEAVDRRRVVRLLWRAARNASNAPERERLLIRYAWAQLANSPSGLALAESLAVRYPNEPNGERSWGASLLWSGDFASGITHLRKALAHDSLGFSARAPVGHCPACDAMRSIVAAQMLQDSIGAAERAAREWIRLQPGSPLPRMALADVLARTGRRVEALAEASIAARASPALAMESWLDVRLALTAGDFQEVHRLLNIRTQDLNDAVRQEALWWTVITFRNEGRLADAEAALARFCHGTRPNDRGAPALDCSLATGPLLFELGRFAEVARLYESIPVAAENQPLDSGALDGLSARHFTWMLTHAANAYAAAGNVTRARALADTIEAWGKLSGFGRDKRLHYYVRGLLAGAAGRHAEASGLFRRAIFSPSEGYTRINLELARELIALREWDAAVAVLRPALRGPVQGGNLYVTQTEIHEMMARAFELAGARDSAATHYRRVAHAWSKSDARFRVRAQTALRKSDIR